MKKILLSAILMFSTVVGAQIVNIPDLQFKQMLLESCSSCGIAKDSEGNWVEIDTNNDGEIQLSETAPIWYLQIISGPIESHEGLEAFTNLRTVKVTLTEISALDVSSLPFLEELIIESLDDLTCDLTELTGLVKLKIEDTHDCNFTGLESLVNLKDIYIDTNDGEEGPLLDLSGMLQIEHLYIDNHDIESIIVGDKPYLQTIEFGMSSLTLELGELPALTKFIHWGIIPQLDFSGSPFLDEINVVISESINLKNGNPSYSEFNVNCYAGVYVCVDEGEEVYFLDDIDNGAIVNSYCSYTPGGDYNTIAGTMAFDGNGNGCDDDDIFNGFAKVTIDDGTESGALYSNTGLYSFFTQAGTFTLTPEFENNWFTATPASVTVTLNTVDNSTTTENFCISANGVHPDVEVLIVPVERAQPGFDAIYKVVYRNNGNQVLSGDVYFVYDDTVLDYVSASPVENNATGGTLGWSYTGLMPFESRHMYVTLNVNGPIETPAVNIDDELVFSASVSPTVGDETLSNNFVAYNETVVGSFDPNDKTCLEGAAITPEMIGEYLHYNINFENTGTAPATFIVVKDVINPAQFDISTLQVLNASHEMVVRVEGNTVEFRFDAINLGPLEKGNVLFKVKTLNTLQIGDEVSNFADIFFDYNFPITTNDATTSFQVLGTGDFEVDSSVMIYPNPTNGIVNITANSNLTSLQLFDLQGRLLQTVLPNDTNAVLDMTSRASGVYLLKVASEKGIKVEKIINE